MHWLRTRSHPDLEHRDVLKVPLQPTEFELVICRNVSGSANASDILYRVLNQPCIYMILVE